MCSDKLIYQIDPILFNHQSDGIIYPAYRVLLFGKDGFSSFIVPDSSLSSID